MSHAVEINARFFALKDGSVGTEIVFLNQNLAIRPTSIVETSTRTSCVRSRIVSSTS